MDIPDVDRILIWGSIREQYEATTKKPLGEVSDVVREHAIDEYYRIMAGTRSRRAGLAFAVVAISRADKEAEHE